MLTLRYRQFGPAYQLSKAAVDHMVRIMAAEFVEFYSGSDTIILLPSEHAY